MFSLLFHKDVFVPDGVQDKSKQLQKQLTTFFLSNHFKEHIEKQGIENRSHTYLPSIIQKCLESLKNEQRECFEVELSKDFYRFGQHGWFITKYCCRIPYDSKQDLVVAIRPQYENSKVVNNMIVTAWMNSNSDHHYTLDRTKYTSEEKWLTV